MARVRGAALVAAGATVCGVAARHLESARKLGGEFGCDRCFDDYRRLADLRLDALLVEVPHHAQDGIVLWALGQGLSVLVGGCLASSAAAAAEVGRLAASGGLVVESGYEARYSAEWESVRRLVADGELGSLVAVRSIALWPGDPASWYYDQVQSGGMPMTHMTYCFLNPVRWILGRPLQVSALANRKCHTAAGLVAEETCLANVLFVDDVPYSLTAGFVRPGRLPGWSVTFIGTRGAVDLVPAEESPASMAVYRDGVEEVQRTDFSAAPDAFQAQARAFLAALDGAAGCRNPPQDTLLDVQTAEAIVRSARELKTITL
jgi:predicted dehydrogenase